MKRILAILTLVTMLVLGGGAGALAGWNAPTLAEVTLESNPLIPTITDDMLDEILTYICAHGRTTFKTPQGERRTFIYGQRLYHAMLIMNLEFVVLEEQGPRKDTSVAYYYHFGHSSKLYAVSLYDISTGKRLQLGELDKSATVYQDWTDLKLYRFWADVVNADPDEQD